MATKPPNDKSWTEPESAANVDNQPQYPYNNITQTQSGHSFEMDDTPSRERIRLQHRSGTFIEMHPNGDEVHKVFGDGYEITINNKNVLIKGHCNLTVDGDCTVEIKGNKIESVAGDYVLRVGGSYSLYGVDEVNLHTKGDMNIGAGSAIGSGSIKLISSDNVYISSDAIIDGGLIADLITSKTRVDATTGVSAGPLGFVSITGGLSIGIPIAVPSQINCAGNINAGIAMSAPIGRFSYMSAILMTDIINTTLYSEHMHITPHGKSSPPIPSMI
jgi:hypothetical protein